MYALRMSVINKEATYLLTYLLTYVGCWTNIGLQAADVGHVHMTSPRRPYG